MAILQGGMWGLGRRDGVSRVAGKTLGNLVGSWAGLVGISRAFARWQGGRTASSCAATGCFGRLAHEDFGADGVACGAAEAGYAVADIGVRQSAGARVRDCESFTKSSPAISPCGR